MPTPARVLSLVLILVLVAGLGSRFGFAEDQERDRDKKEKKFVYALDLAPDPERPQHLTKVAPTDLDAFLKHATVMVINEVPIKGEDVRGWGSGLILNRNGLVMTNNHVVDFNHGRAAEERWALANVLTKSSYYVLVYDQGKKWVYPCTLLHRLESCDLALLQIDKLNGAPVVTPNFIDLADDDVVAEDMKVTMTGFPGGEMRGTDMITTVGLVTEVAKTPTGALSYIETDAEGHPGNSGGPMTDESGQLIGVVALKYFKEGEKDRSGAIPVNIVRQFLRSGFIQDRLPKDTDVFPFTDVFIDHDGLVEIPQFSRDIEKDEIKLHFDDGSIRIGNLHTTSLRITTPLGQFEVPLEQVAYIFTDGDQRQYANFVMDGGDRLLSLTSGITVDATVGGERRHIPLRSIDIAALPKQLDTAPQRVGDGVIFQGAGCVLNLTEVDGEIRIAGSSYELGEIERVSASRRERVQIVTTANGEVLRGRIGERTVAATVTWSPTPIALSFRSLTDAYVRDVDWRKVLSKGRLLAARIKPFNDEIAILAELLDTQDWADAEGLVTALDQQLSANDYPPRAFADQVRLMEGVYKVRAGEYDGARELFDRLDRSRYVGDLAGCYRIVLEEFPKGTYRGAPLSDPEIFWRASTQAARQHISQAQRQLAELDEADRVRKKRELDRLEEHLAMVDYLEPGVALAALLETLEAAFYMNFEELQQIRDDYYKVVRDHNREHNRLVRVRYRRELRSMEDRFERVVREIERLQEQARKFASGFVIAPPELKRGDTDD